MRRKRDLELDNWDGERPTNQTGMRRDRADGAGGLGHANGSGVGDLFGGFSCSIEVFPRTSAVAVRDLTQTKVPGGEFYS